MKTRKVLFLLILPFVAEFIIACCNCNLDTQYGYFSNCNINISELDNSGEKAVVTTSNTIPKEAFGIRISIDRVDNTCYFNSTPSFLYSAFATSCDCPPEFEYLAKDSIVDIEIITTNSYNTIVNGVSTSHNAGSDISKFFYAYSNYEYIEISKYIKNMNYGIKNNIIEQYTFDLLLMSPPEVTSQHQFIVNIELSDGRVLSEQTNLITLQ